MSLENNSNIVKITSFLKESYIDKTLFFMLDSNLYLDCLKYRLGYINPYFADVYLFFNFLIEYNIPIFNFNPINQEVDKKISIIFSKQNLNRAQHEIKSLRDSLNFSKLYFPTDQDLSFSEKYGFVPNSFNEIKDNRTDLLIILSSINNNLKVIVTRNHNDFNQCLDFCKEKSNLPNLDLLICHPSDLYTITKEFKSQVGDLN